MAKKNNPASETEALFQPEPVKRTGRVLGFIKELFSIVFISLAIVIPVRYFVIQPFLVKGASMEPSFFNGEYLIINEIGYRVGEPERGDVVVFKYPKDPSEYYIKRVIGLPGETVKIEGGQVVIYNDQHPSGQSLDESNYLPSGRITRGNFEVKLEPDEYFVLGDNRNASSDSRVWGTLPREMMIGKTWIRAFPFQSFTIFRD